MLKEILEQYDDEEILVADGFDEAVIGIATDFIDQPRLIYSVNKCIDILMNRDEMDYTDAMEYFTYNVSGAYIENCPIWCWDDFD
tara:strand:- start:9631 stop:9885 length:255 start_codon:yes stop_codon:yes gene_type:complete